MKDLKGKVKSSSEGLILVAYNKKFHEDIGANE